MKITSRFIEEMYGFRINLPKALKPRVKLTIGWAQPYPIFFPWGYIGGIIRVSKEDLRLRKTGYNFKIFGRYVSIGWPIVFRTVSLGYKTKWRSDDYRFEWSPSAALYFFKFEIRITIVPPKGYKNFVDDYWEQVLFLRHYGYNIDQAEENWGWMDNGESTWNLSAYLDN